MKSSKIFITKNITDRKRTKAELLFDGDLNAWNTLATEHFRRFYEMFHKLPFTKEQAKDIIYEAIEKVRCEAQPHPHRGLFVCDIRREISVLIHLGMEQVRIKIRNEKRMNGYYWQLHKYGKIMWFDTPPPLSVQKKVNWDKKLNNRIVYLKEQLDCSYYQIGKVLKMSEQQVKDIYLSLKRTSNESSICREFSGAQGTRA